jgi:hypothetical protein
MKTINSILVILFFSFSAIAQKNADKVKTKVFLLGVFHFDNPGMDFAKTKNTDILSEKSQREIQDIVNMIASTKPEKIFLEAEPSYQPKMDSLYSVFLNGGLKNDKDESTQIGFRLMKQLGLKKSFCVDKQMPFSADSLINTWKMSKQDAYFDDFMAIIKGFETESNSAIESGMSLKQRLHNANTPENRNTDLASYTFAGTMKAGKKGNFIGADVATEWYSRNIRIYSNILRELDGNEKSIFVMFGSSHQCILSHLFALHPDEFELIDVPKLLK